MTDFGTDFFCLDDLSGSLVVASDRLSFLQALARRITTPRGALWYAPDYGYDVTAFVNTATDPAVIEGAVESELLADERVTDATATLTVTEADDRGVTSGQAWTLDVAIVAGDDPFDFTLGVDAVTGEILLTAVS